MTMAARPLRVLLLAGGGESHALAEGLARLPDVAAHALWAEPMRGKGPLAISTEETPLTRPALEREIALSPPDLVIDSTHPFDTDATGAAAALCAMRAIDRLQVLRPSWSPQAGDRWTRVGSIAEAAPHFPEGARVFATTGRGSLPALSALAHCRLFLRQLSPHDQPCPLKNGVYVPGNPPFSVADEVAVLRGLDIDWLLTRDTGGGISNTKLIAARQLQLPVAMLDRPPGAARPPVVAGAAAALAWIAGR